MKFRTFASSLTFIMFLIIGITGICMIFHVRVGLITPLHILGGFLFVVAAILHCVVNRHAILNYLKRKPVRIATIAACALIIAAFVISPGDSQKDGRRVLKKISPELLVNLNAQELGVVTRRGTGLALFEMERAGLVPDSVTPVSLLAKRAKMDAYSVVARIVTAK